MIEVKQALAKYYDSRKIYFSLLFSQETRCVNKRFTTGVCTRKSRNIAENFFPRVWDVNACEN